MNIASSNLLINFVKMNFGIGYVTKMYVEDELNDGSIIELIVNPKPSSIDYGIITLKNNVFKNDVRLFINSLKLSKN